MLNDMYMPAPMAASAKQDYVVPRLLLSCLLSQFKGNCEGGFSLLICLSKFGKLVHRTW